MNSQWPRTLSGDRFYSQSSILRPFRTVYPFSLLVRSSSALLLSLDFSIFSVLNFLSLNSLLPLTFLRPYTPLFFFLILTMSIGRHNYKHAHLGRLETWNPFPSLQIQYLKNHCFEIFDPTIIIWVLFFINSVSEVRSHWVVLHSRKQSKGVRD